MTGSGRSRRTSACCGRPSRAPIAPLRRRKARRSGRRAARSTGRRAAEAARNAVESSAAAAPTPRPSPPPLAPLGRRMQPEARRGTEPDRRPDRSAWPDPGRGPRGAGAFPASRAARRRASGAGHHRQGRADRGDTYAERGVLKRQVPHLARKRRTASARGRLRKRRHRPRRSRGAVCADETRRRSNCTGFLQVEFSFFRSRRLRVFGGLQVRKAGEALSERRLRACTASSARSNASRKNALGMRSTRLAYDFEPSIIVNLPQPEVYSA